MKTDDHHTDQIASLRDRLTKFVETGIRINESLEFDTVLQSVLDSARMLVGARYGVIALQDENGEVQNFLSSGMSADEAGRLWELPEKVFENLNAFPGPKRFRDLRAHIGSLGIDSSPIPVGDRPFLSLLVVPVRHMGRRMGCIFIGGKETVDEFSVEDEETLVMFASQAALVIANAQAFRAERRARADLETLINTSPVGVVVFDAGTGQMVSVNREARRIVEDLWTPDQSAEEVLGTVTIVRADGREFSIHEIPMSDLLKNAETIRVEEVVLKVPDGRSVITLINATPIFADDGTVASCVVTMQDLTPIHSLERLRAEFLGVVSHELRDPLTSIKGSATTLIEAIDDLEPAEMLQFYRIINEQTDRMRDLIGELLQVARIETGTLSIRPEPVNPVEVIDEAKNRFVSGGGRKEISIVLAPSLPRIMADGRRIVQVLRNLLYNAEKFSPESSPIRIAAEQKDLRVEFSVSDRGRGVAPDEVPRLFSNIANRVPETEGGVLGGSGIGLRICKGIVEAHGGRIWAESEGLGQGTRFTFSLPAFSDEAAVGAGRLARSSSAESAERGRLHSERILAVDDDPEVLRSVRIILERAGYAPVVTGDPDEVAKLMLENEPSLVLLDLLLPGTDGIKLMKRISDTADVPVIFLSAYNQEEVVGKAFEQGAADYIVKPFTETELLARIGAALRRRISWKTTEPQGPYFKQGLSIDYDERRVAVSGRVIELTATEYNMLYELSANAPRVIGYEELLQRIWGARPKSGLGVVRTVVKRLRQKLRDDAGEPRHIFNVPRVGYRMAKGDSADDRVAE